MFRNFRNLKGSSKHAGNQISRWRTAFIALLLALVIGSAGQTHLAQAAPARELVNFSMEVQNPKTKLRCGETVTYLVQVELQQTGAPTPSPGALGFAKGLSVVNINVEATSIDMSVGDFVGKAIAKTAVVFDDDVTGLGAKFKFKANKPGKTTLNFEGFVGKEYVSAHLDVKVLPCKFKATTIGEWHVPGPANISVVAISDDAEVDADEQGTLTGSTSVNWVVTAGQVGDCIAQSETASSQVDWSGNMNDQGQLMMDAKYQTAEISLPVFCVGSDGGIASGSTPVQLTPDPLQVSLVSEGGVFRELQVLQGPESMYGFVTIVVVPVDDEAAAFIPTEQDAVWDDFISLFGALLTLY